jgi:hypothetical protein
MHPSSRLIQLKAAQNWTLSDSRLKKVLAEDDLKRQEEEPKSLPPIPLPADALAAQQRYKRDSIRVFKLYGLGEYDFRVTPNADMAMLMDVSQSVRQVLQSLFADIFQHAHNRLVEAGAPGPWDSVGTEAIARSPFLLTI